MSQNKIDLQPGDFTGMLVSMCSCAPEVSHMDSFSIDMVIALDLIKFCRFSTCLHFYYLTNNVTGHNEVIM